MYTVVVMPKKRPNNNTMHIKPDDILYRMLVLRAQKEQRTLHNLVLVLLRKAVSNA